MVWQDAFSPTGGPSFDAEDERERRLAAQARAGADWALTALIARYQPTVMRYLTRLCGNQALARTLAERIFQRMERRLHGPHGAEHLRLWLLRASTEAGLDALRRPKTAPMPRLGSGGVAGLLAEVSGKDAPALLQHGLRRLRKAAGVAARQTNPLVWTDGAARDTAGAAPAPGENENHLDETLDHLDPRDALRHRLVRVTLAEMPYGDAQCLALHLVAGLNQAEVAQALGITNSAARKRMVHGLALFSERYAQAVQSLGLPVELGFGDAIPRAPLAPEPITKPTPPPVVISSRASEPLQSPPAAPAAQAEDRLIAVNPTIGDGADALSSVLYVSEDSGPTPSVTPGAMQDVIAPSEVAYESPYESPYEPPYATPDDEAHSGDLADAADSFTAYAQGSVTVAVDERDARTPEAPLAESEPAPVSGAPITRVAADAIIGPIVDALPVIPASPALPDTEGLAAPRSMPLAFELSSDNTHEATNITMNWLDDSGLMTPLTFESVAVASGIHNLPEASSPLGFESVAVPSDEPPISHEADPTETPLSFELSQAATDEPVTLTPTAEPVLAGDTEAEALAKEPTLGPITVPVLTAPTDDEADADEGTTSPADEPFDEGLLASGPEREVITRSLEALWDELSEGADL